MSHKTLRITLANRCKTKP